MSFDDIAFPVRLARGSSGGPSFSTEVVEVASGYESRNRNWARARLTFDVGSRTVDLPEWELLRDFFYARGGRARGFRYPDPLDFKSCAAAAVPGPLDQPIGTGDGANMVFALTRRYVSGAVAHSRTITRPRAGSVRVARGGVEVTSGFSVDADTGRVIFTTPPAFGVAVTAGFAFDVPVRFDSDSLTPIAVNKRVVQLPEIPLIEVRE